MQAQSVHHGRVVSRQAAHVEVVQGVGLVAAVVAVRVAAVVELVVELAAAEEGVMVVG